MQNGRLTDQTIDLSRIGTIRHAENLGWVDEVAT